MIQLSFLGFGKQTSSLPIHGYATNKMSEDSIKSQIPKVIAKLKDLGVGRQQRQRISSEYGVWFCKKDDKGFFFFALCSSNYPERHVYACINELRTHLATIGDYSSQPDSTLKLHAKAKMVELSNKYNNPQSLDKLGQANRIISDLKDDISHNTKLLVDNQANLDGLHQKTLSLKENAQMFESNSATIQREMKCRNWKLTIIIGLVVVALICVIVIPIVTKK